jgi:nitrogen-specific signal transduction histidine kinase
MKLLNNHRHLLFFIASSLLLLAVLEGFWLKKLYNEQREHIRQDIDHYVFANMNSMQITLMAKNNVRLIDSFLSEKEGNDQRMKAMFVGAYDKNGKMLGTYDFIDKEQAIFLKKLDTLANLQYGAGKDSAEIIAFIEKLETDFNRFKVNQKPQNEKDSLKFIDDFLKNQKRFYTSLWYIYRIIEKNPNVNRVLLDSFFTAQREYYEWVDKNLWHIQAKSMKYNPNAIETMPRFSIKKGKKNIVFEEGKKVTVTISDTFNPKKGNRDSFLQRNAYQFQRFVGGKIQPDELKEKLEKEFTNLNFNVSRIDADSLIEWNLNKGIVVTFPAGSRPIVDEYGVSYKNQKLAVVATGFQSAIFKTIYPEILFALFVLLMIGLSFWLIYRNVLQQKRLVAMKNDFISNVTHELKTPIATVGVAVEALNSFNALENPARTKEYLDISKSELNRLSLLVDKVLKMAVFEQGEPQLNIETFNLADLTQEILNSMKLQFERFGADVSFEKISLASPSEIFYPDGKEGDDNFIINADKTHITSVIYNLIDNALKYGGEKPEINILLQAPFYNFIHLSVADKGAGIPPQYKDKIFEKFFRIPSGDVHNTKGHGLGLSYVMSVVKQHKGKINVESEEGKGSTFSIFLPLSDAE